MRRVTLFGWGDLLEIDVFVMGWEGLIALAAPSRSDPQGWSNQNVHFLWAGLGLCGGSLKGLLPHRNSARSHGMSLLA